MSSDREQIVHDLSLILGTITSFGTLTLSVGSFDIKPRLINQPCCSFIFFTVFITGMCSVRSAWWTIWDLL